MKRSVLRTASALAVLLLLSVPESVYAQARLESSDRRALLDLEKRWLQSEDNPDALATILADDFVHVLPLGFITKSEQLRYMRTHPANQHGTAKSFEDLRVRIFHDTGIVNGIVVATGADGKIRKTIFTDVFLYRNGSWQAVNAQESPFTPPARP